MEAEVPRFILLEGTIDDLIDEQENKNTSAKTDRNAMLLKIFLQREEELRNVEEIPPAQLNELLSEFVLTVSLTVSPCHLWFWTKDDNDFEPTLLRGYHCQFWTIPQTEKLSSWYHQQFSVWENSQNAALQAKTAQETRERQQAKCVCTCNSKRKWRSCTTKVFLECQDQKCFSTLFG